VPSGSGLAGLKLAGSKAMMMFTHLVPAGFQSATMPRTPATSEGVAVVPQVFSVSPQS